MSKEKLEIFTIIFTIITLLIGCAIMNWLFNNNMESCMVQYKDYNYCKAIIEEGTNNER